MALSKTTQDHAEIQQWAETRGAVPAEVASTEIKGQTGILRLEFPTAKNANDSALKEISWDEFFEKFDATGLALVYQEQTAEGEQSNFNKLIYPEDPKNSKAKLAKKATTKKAAGTKAASKTTLTSKSSAVKSSKTATKKTAIKKIATKKTATKKTATAKAATRKSATTRTAKSPASKTAKTSQAAANKAPARKSASKKASGARSKNRSKNR